MSELRSGTYFPDQCCTGYCVPVLMEDDEYVAEDGMLHNLRRNQAIRLSELLDRMDAHARTDVPALLAEVERLNDAIGFHVRREMAVDKVLDKALGSEEADGAGQGMAADVHLLARARDASDRRAEAAEALVAEKDAEIERLRLACGGTITALADVTRERDDLRARVKALADEYDRQASEEGYGGELWSTTAAAIREAIALLDTTTTEEE